MPIKGGLLTFTWADNYGAVLQNYALESWIRDNYSGILDLRTVNYVGYVGRGYLPGAKYPLPHNSFRDRILVPARIVNRLLARNYQKYAKSAFVSFRNCHLHLSERLTDKQSLKKWVDGLDFVITGSDQVFNKKITVEDDDVYTLNLFCEDVFRIGYAISAGSIENIGQMEQTALLILDEVSCREEQLKCFIQKGRKDVVRVLDPVLLQRKEKWEALVAGMERPKDRYLLTYMLPSDSNGYVNDICRKLGLKHYSIDWNPRSLGRAHLCKGAGPAEFVQLIMDAELMITSSFHATAFCTIFHKPLICILNTNTSRITDFAEAVGIESLIHKTGDRNAWENSLDWDAVDSKVETLRRFSESWLRDAIGKVVNGKN